MFLSFGLIVDAVLLALGIYWCFEVFERRHSDIEKLREVDDNIQRAVIVGFWLVTLVIALLVINFAWEIVTDVISGVREFI